MSEAEGLAIAYANAKRRIEKLEQWGDAAQAEISRLKRIIADAPHDQNCMAWCDKERVAYGLESKPCDCWKSRVLNDESNDR